MVCSQKFVYKELETFAHNPAVVESKVDQILEAIEDASIRFAKLFFMKNVLFAGLESCAEKYRKIPEFQYDLIEAFYL